MRPFLLATILFLISALPSPAAGLGRHLPADARWVVGLEVPLFLRSPVVHDCLPALLRRHGPTAVEALLSGYLPHDADLVKRLAIPFSEPDAALALAGERFDRVLIAATGNRAQSSLFVIVEGRFSATEVHACVKRFAPLLWPGCSMETIRMVGRDVYHVGLPGKEDNIYIGMPDDGTVVITPDAVALSRILNQADRGRGSPAAILADLVQHVDGTKTPLWVVGAPQPSDGLAPFHGGMDFSNGLHGGMMFTAHSQDEARELVDDLNEIHEEIVDTAKDLLHKGRKVDALVKVLQAVTIKRVDNKVEMKLEVPTDELKRESSR